MFEWQQLHKLQDHNNKWFSQGEIQACVETDIEIFEIFNVDFHGYFALDI